MSILRTHSSNWQLSIVKGSFNICAKYFALFLAAATLVSCGGDKKPDAILSHEQMAAVLVEMYIMEEKVSRMGLRSDSATQVMKLLEGDIATKAGVADSLWKKSYIWYTNRPQELQTIYAIAIDSLQLREQRADVVSPLRQ